MRSPQYEDRSQLLSFCDTSCLGATMFAEDYGAWLSWRWYLTITSVMKQFIFAVWAALPNQCLSTTLLTVNVFKSHGWLDELRRDIPGLLWHFLAGIDSRACAKYLCVYKLVHNRKRGIIFQGFILYVGVICEHGGTVFELRLNLWI